MEPLFSNLTLIMPEMVLVFAILALTLLGAFYKDNVLITRLAIVTLLTVLVMIIKTGVSSYIYIFNHGLVNHKFIELFKTTTPTNPSAILLIHHALAKQEKIKNNFEFPLIILITVLGMLLLISANGFINLYLALELQSLGLYVLASSNRDNLKSSEAGLKYFVLGAVASAIMLYGISLIYGFTGTMNFDGLVGLYLTDNKINSVPAIVIIASIMIMSSILFKVAAVPFHMWAPDVYEGSPTLVTAYFSVVPKITAFVVLVRLIFEPFVIWHEEMRIFLIAAAILSLVVGAFGAIKQTNIKRMLAYSSIGHVGFLLLGMLTYSIVGIKAIIIYLVIYAVMSLGVFAIVIIREKTSNSANISDFAGLSKEHPFLAIIMAILMFSMAGIPPLAGFFAKFNILIAAIDAKLYVLSIIAVITSVVSAFYYINIVKVMYFDDKKADFAITYYPFEIIAVASVCAIINLLFFIYPSIVSRIAIESANLLF
jgi:NADH-quinone oxidoreductase subunit N